VDVRGAEPSITSIGRAVMPEGTNGNAVTSLPDGGILATSIIDAGHAREEAFSGQVSGGVYEWHRKTGFHLIPGTELSGDNGLEVSPDGKQFYVNAIGGRSVTRFTRGGFELEREKVDLDFGPDNIRWGQNGLLFVSGRADEPACGGTLAARNGKLDSECLRGFEVVTLDPKTMKVQLIVSAKPDPIFNVGALRCKSARRFGYRAFARIASPTCPCDRHSGFPLPQTFHSRDRKLPTPEPHEGASLAERNRVRRFLTCDGRRGVRGQGNWPPPLHPVLAAVPAIDDPSSDNSLVRCR
jgi:hypothetical protein